MPSIHDPAIIKSARDALPAGDTGNGDVSVQDTTFTSLSLVKNTVAFVLGAVEDADGNYQRIKAKIVDDDDTKETGYLDGTKSQAYHVAKRNADKTFTQQNDQHVLVFGPYTEDRELQVTVYHVDGQTSTCDKVTQADFKQFDDTTLHTHITLIPVFDSGSPKQLLTVVEVTRMAVKQPKTADGTLSFYKQDISASPIDLVIDVKSLKKTFGGTGIAAWNSGFLSGRISGTLYYDDIKDLTGFYVYKVTTIKDSDGKIFCTINAKKGAENSLLKFKFVASGDLDEDKEYPGTHSAELDNGFIGGESWYDDIV